MDLFKKIFYKVKQMMKFSKIVKLDTMDFQRNTMEIRNNHINIFRFLEIFCKNKNDL